MLRVQRLATSEYSLAFASAMASSTVSTMEMRRSLMKRIMKRRRMMMEKRKMKMRKTIWVMGRMRRM